MSWEALQMEAMCWMLLQICKCSVTLGFANARNCWHLAWSDDVCAINCVFVKDSRVGPFISSWALLSRNFHAVDLRRFGTVWIASTKGFGPSGAIAEQRGYPAVPTKSKRLSPHPAVQGLNIVFLPQKEATTVLVECRIPLEWESNLIRSPSFLLLNNQKECLQQFNAIEVIVLYSGEGVAFKSNWCCSCSNSHSSTMQTYIVHYVRPRTILYSIALYSEFHSIIDHQP